MAAVSNNDCFTIGSTVLSTTCFNEEVEGEVLAFDHNSKMLILKCRSKTSDKLSDIHVLNLALCSNVQVIKETNGNLVEDPQKLNLEQLKIRLRKNVQQRQTYLKSKNADVSIEAQELYRVIAKQFKFNEVSWQGPNIQIFNEVIVAPPYRVENVVSIANNKSLCNYIKKMIEQFNNRAPAPESSVASGSSSTSSSLSSSSAPSASTGNSSSTSSSNAAAGSPVTAN